jgi:excisionase family DNA binding protein
MRKFDFPHVRNLTVIPQCFSIAETAKMLNVSVGTVRGCISVGSLPVMRIGRRVVVTRTTLENLLGGPIA